MYPAGPDCRVVVVGGGYIGLEVAASATKLGASVTVLEAQERVRPNAGMSAEEVGIEIADIAVRGIATDDWLKASAVRSSTDS